MAAAAQAVLLQPPQQGVATGPLGWRQVAANRMRLESALCSSWSSRSALILSIHWISSSTSSRGRFSAASDRIISTLSKDMTLSMSMWAFFSTLPSPLPNTGNRALTAWR